MKTTSKFSTILVDFLPSTIQKMKGLVIQVDYIKPENHAPVYLYEFIPDELVPFYREEQQINHELKVNLDKSNELEEALNTVLKTDPFGGKWSGHTLQEIKQDDQKWWNYALDNLKNTFILNRMQLIEKHEIQG